MFNSKVFLSLFMQQQINPTPKCSGPGIETNAPSSLAVMHM